MCVCVWAVGGCHVTHSSHNINYVLFIFSYFIQNIPKRSNYIMKYLDCHLDGQSSL